MRVTKDVQSIAVNRADEVLKLMTAAHAWYRAGETKKQTGKWPEYYPQYRRVRQLGEEIYRADGFEGLQRVAEFVGARGGADVSNTVLSHMWEGVGVPKGEGGSGRWLP